MKPFLLVACLALAAVVGVPTAAKDHALPFKPVTGAFFALSVANMAQSVQWYREKLGLAVVMEVTSGPEVTVLEGGGLIVELIRVPGSRPRPEPSVSTLGVFKAGFLVKDFDAAVAELRARGVTIAFGPFPATDTQKANVIIQDNAGNLIQLFGS